MFHEIVRENRFPFAKVRDRHYINNVLVFSKEVSDWSDQKLFIRSKRFIKLIQSENTPS